MCSKLTYDTVWASLAALPRNVEHIVVQLGIPIAYPRMNFMEYVATCQFVITCKYSFMVQVCS